MKIITKSVGLALLIAAMSGNALAEPGRGYSHGSPYRNYQGRQHGSDWIAPLLFLGIAGAVIGAAASQPSTPSTTYVSPPVTYAPPMTYGAPVVIPAPPPAPTTAWYFCQSVGQYYPYTQHCPEGWQLVTPPQR